MKPIEFPGSNTVFAKDQTEYLPLPAHKKADGEVTSCWQLDEEERKKIAQTGLLYVTMLTFNQPLQPLRPSVDNPAEPEPPKQTPMSLLEWADSLLDSIHKSMEAPSYKSWESYVERWRNAKHKLQAELKADGPPAPAEPGPDFKSISEDRDELLSLLDRLVCQSYDAKDVDKFSQALERARYICEHRTRTGQHLELSRLLDTLLKLWKDGTAHARTASGILRQLLRAAGLNPDNLDAEGNPRPMPTEAELNPPTQEQKNYTPYCECGDPSCGRDM